MHHLANRLTSTSIDILSRHKSDRPLTVETSCAKTSSGNVDLLSLDRCGDVYTDSVTHRLVELH